MYFREILLIVGYERYFVAPQVVFYQAQYFASNIVDLNHCPFPGRLIKEFADAGNYFCPAMAATYHGI